MSGASEAHPVPDEGPKKRSFLVWVSCLSPWRFVLFASIAGAISNLLLIPILEFLVVHYQLALPKEAPVAILKKRYGVAGLFFCGVVAIPWYETLLGQALPMVLTRALVKPTVPYMVLATVWFACLHAVGVGSDDLIAPRGVLYPRRHISARVESLLVERHLDDDHRTYCRQPYYVLVRSLVMGPL
jgi:hypothetical protein